MNTYYLTKKIFKINQSIRNLFKINREKKRRTITKIPIFHLPLPEKRVRSEEPSPLPPLLDERPWPEGAHVRELCLLPFLHLEASGGRKRDLDS